MLAPSPAPGLLGRPHLDPRRRGLLALAASRDADDRAHADAWRRRRLRERWRRHRREEEARERYREGLIGAFAAGDAEGLLPGAARGSSAGGGLDLGNIGRGIGERAADLAGGLLGVNNILADELRRHLPPLGWFDADRGAYVAGRLPPERDAMKAAARRLEDLDLGYAPGTTWEAVKRSPAAKAVAFAVEQGLVSVPDMALALASLPTYVLARTGELAGARAEADLRKDATVGDLAASALLERLGARRILGIGDALGSRSPRGVADAAGRGSAVEGLTETGQEGIEHLTSRLGTATGVAPHEMADAMMAGGAAGAIFGGGVRGATATGQALLGRPQARESGFGTRAAPSVAPSPVRPEPRGTPTPVGAQGRGKPTPPVEMATPDDRGRDRPVLDPSRAIPVVNTVSSFSHLPTINAMRRAARQFVRTLRDDLRVRPPTNLDTGKQIVLSAEGAEKVVSGYRTPEDFDALTALRGLIERAVHVEAVPDREARPGVKAVHSFYGAARTDTGKLLRVRLFVNENVNGVFVYDTHTAIMESPDAIAQGTPAQENGRPISDASGPRATLGALLAGVNYEDGTPIFPAPGERRGGGAPEGSGFGGGFDPDTGMGSGPQGEPW